MNLSPLHLKYWPRQAACTLIRLYQKTLSPDHGWLLRGRYPYGFCRYYPSCSEYAYQTIAHRGIIAGTPRVIIRLLRCNPWASPDVDLVEPSGQ